MLQVENVYKSYGDFEAVKGISFQVNKGEIVGLLGPNGAGKTTIMRMLTAYHFPSTGSIEIDKLELTKNPEEIKNKIGYLPENAPAYAELSVADYLQFQSSVRIHSRSGRKQAIEKSVTSCNLEDVYFRPISELSKGYKQRVGLAQAILHDPEILILDEPTSGLDPNQIQEIRRLIRNLGQEKTIILSSHIMQEVEATCDRVLILNKGSIVAHGDTQSIGKDLRGSNTSFYVHFQSISADGIAELSQSEEVSQVEVLESGLRVQIHSALSENEVFLFDWAVKKGLKIKELHIEKLSLEDVFITLTKEDE